MNRGINASLNCVHFELNE